MNKQIGRMESFYAEGNEEVTPLPDFIEIKIYIVRHHYGHHLSLHRRAKGQL